MTTEEREKVKETGSKFIESGKSFKDTDISEITGIPRASVALYLKHNFQKWGWVRVNIHKNPLSSQRWAYAGSIADITYRSYESPSQIRERLEAQKRHEMRRDHDERIGKIQKSSRQKPKPEKINIGEWIIDFHRSGGRVDFNEVMEGFRIEFREHYKRSIDTKTENEVTAVYRTLVDKGDIIFDKEDGTSYLPSYLSKLFI